MTARVYRILEQSMAETRDNARVIAAVDDMFFASKIRGAAAGAGREVEFVKSQQQLEEKLSKGPVSLIIIDLNSERMDSTDVIRALKSNPASSEIQIIGFLSHVQVDLMQRARDAGCNQVMARSAFSQRLTEILSLPVGDLRS